MGCLRTLLQMFIAVLFLTLSGSLPAWAERRAFLVAINDYLHLSDLGKPISDVAALETVLHKKLGFKVEKVENPGRKQLRESWGQFLQSVNSGDVVFVHFAGHGVQLPGSAVNYLLPADVEFDDLDVARAQSFDHSKLIDQLQARKPQVTIWVLDACRNNPFNEPTPPALGMTKSASLGRTIPLSDGLRATPDIGDGGTFILYSAGYGEIALDSLELGEPSPYSLYVRHLLDLIAQPKLSLVNLATTLRDKVASDAATKHMVDGKHKYHSQQPAYYNGVRRDFCLAGPDDCGSASTPIVQAPPPEAPEHACDRLAADPRDPARKVKHGIPAPQLTRDAILECRRARREYPSEPRFIFQLARALVRQAEIVARQGGAEGAESREKIDEALDELQHLDKLGDTRAAAYLGGLYFDGLGGRRDEVKALEYTRRAADAANPMAMTRMGFFYITGRAGLPKDFKAALEWTKRAAASQDPVAIANHGWLIKQGHTELEKGAEADRLALEYFLKAYGDDPARDNSNGVAASNIGTMYHDGRGGFEKNAAKAREKYEKAAEQEEAWGLANLAWYLLHGKGGLVINPENDRRALALLRIAFASRNGRAAAYLGDLFRDGRAGLNKDEGEALALYRRANEWNDPVGKTSLGWFYMNGKAGLGVSEANDIEAVRLFRLAEQEGEASAINNLGVMHEAGRGGLEKSDDAARAYYERADAAGEVWGTTNLANFHYRGRGGLQQDFSRAFALYEKAAAEENPRAMYALARMYHYAEGVEVDVERSNYWLEKAAKKGHVDALAIWLLELDKRRDWDTGVELLIQHNLGMSEEVIVGLRVSRDFVKRLQVELQRRGGYDGKIDGVWGLGTIEAFRRLRHGGH